MIFRKIAEWFSGNKNTDKPHPLDGPIRAAEEKTYAPYKLEPPAPAPAPVVETKPVEAVNAIAEPAKCGCGRSPTGLCVGLHKLTTEEWSAHADNPNRVVAAEEKPAKKPAAKKPKAEKPASKKAPAKKPAAAKKAPAKKPATKKKADAVVQAPARKTTTRKSK